MKNITLRATWVIKAPTEEVFAVMTDFEKFPEHFPKVAETVRIIKRDGNHLEIEATAKSFGRSFKVNMKTEILPGKGFISDNDSYQFGTSGHEEMLLSPHVEGTRIDYTYQVTIHKAWLRIVATPLIKWYSMKAWEKAVIEELRKIVENKKSYDLVHLFRAEDVSAAINIHTIGDHFMFLPTHPFALEILNLQSGLLIDALGNAASLGLYALVFILLYSYASPSFYASWLLLQEGTSEDADVSQKALASRKTYHFTGGKTTALFMKEALLSGRNWKAVLWFLFLSSIWLTQIAANVIMGHNIQKYQPDIASKTILLQVIQFIIAIYFISSFTLRFAFTSFSAEKKTAWILLSAPLSFKKMFYGKYLFYTTACILLGVFMNTVNAWVLGLSLIHTVYVTTLFVVSIMFIVTLGISFGALFPNTESDDPEIISTSMPGLFFTALALLYGALCDGALYLSLTQEKSTWITLCILITIPCIIALLAIVPSRAAQKRLL